MKYPKARISKFSERDGYYVWLTGGTYLSNCGEVFDFHNECGDHEEKVKQLIFTTEELAQEALDKFNNPMTKTRNYPALKQEGPKFAPEGFVYIGRGDMNDKLNKDWPEKEIYMYSEKDIPERRLDIREDDIDRNWNGNSSDAHYFVREEIWNKKFPAAKKSITLDEIKSQYEEAKKLIGKTVKVQGYPAAKVIDVKLYIESCAVSGAVHEKFFNENGYIISLKVKDSTVSAYEFHACEVVKDVKVVLNSSHIAIISPEGITVGCQKFPLDIIDKLVAAKKELA